MLASNLVFGWHAPQMGSNMIKRPQNPTDFIVLQHLQCGVPKASEPKMALVNGRVTNPISSEDGEITIVL